MTADQAFADAVSRNEAELSRFELGVSLVSVLRLASDEGVLVESRRHTFDGKVGVADLYATICRAVARSRSCASWPRATASW